MQIIPQKLIVSYVKTTENKNPKVFKTKNEKLILKSI